MARHLSKTLSTPPSAVSRSSALPSTDQRSSTTGDSDTDTDPSDSESESDTQPGDGDGDPAGDGDGPGLPSVLRGGMLAVAPYGVAVR